MNIKGLRGVNQCMAVGERGFRIVRCQVSGLRGGDHEQLYDGLERKVPEQERRWQLAEESAVYGVNVKAGPLLLNNLPDT